MYQIVVMNDLHIPLHDPRAVKLVFDIIEDICPAQVIINGDFADFYLLNSHSAKDPQVPLTLEDEMFECNKYLDLLQKKAPNSEILYIMGNHEWRLDRFIRDKCPVFWNRISVEKEFQLERRGIRWVPYNEAYRIPRTELFIQHSPPSYGENGARTSILKKPGASFIWGCTHRLQQANITDAMGKVRSGYFNGWLGSTTLSDSHKAVFKYTKNHENWQQGFAIVSVIGNQAFVNQYQIKKYKTCVGGVLYEG